MPAFELDIYARQEFKTPGEPATLDLVSSRCDLGPESLVLEVACGKGEAACILAERHGCRVLGIDGDRSSVRFAAAKARHRRLRRLVTFAWGDGRRLPVADGRFDLAVCIGAPSIVGLPDCWREMRRTLRPGGRLAVSDAVVSGRAPSSVRAGWPPWAAKLMSLRAYAGGLEREGLTVEAAELMPPPVWDEYHRPMLALIEEVRRYRRRDREALAWAERNQAMIEAERAALPHLAYAHFLARSTG